MTATTIAAAATGLPFSRHNVERMIERLISMLDDFDTDCDFEDNADSECYLAGSVTDLEYDDAASGIADDDGLAEQGFYAYRAAGVE